MPHDASANSRNRLPAGEEGPGPAAQLQEATYRIAEAALTAVELDQLYASVHQIVRGLLPADNFYIALHHPAEGMVSFPYWVDEKEPSQPTRPFHRGLTELVLRTGKAQLVSRPELEALVEQGEVVGIGPTALDWLGVPLAGPQGVFGVLAVQSYDGGYRYRAEERDLLAYVSGQVAMAIQRKRAETERRLLATAVDRSQDGIFAMESDGRFIFVNEAACQGLGYTREELLAMRVFDIDPSLTEASWAQIWPRIRSGEVLRFETSQRRKDGTFRPVEVSRSLFRFEGREVLFASVRDITERMAAAEALRLSETKFARAFQTSPDAINITRVSDGTYLDVSEGFARLTGWSREEAVGRSALDLGVWANPGDRSRVIELLLRDKAFTGFEADFRRKDGSLLHGLMSGRYLDVDGVPCLLTFTRDITDLRRTTAALQASERRLWTVLRNTQAVIFQLDSEGRFLLSEGAALGALGLHPGQMLGLSALEVYRDEPSVVNQIRQALSGEGSRRMIRAGGRAWDNTLTPVRDAQGHVESVIGIALDVTVQQDALQALEAERGLFVGGPVMVIRWQARPPWSVDYVSPNVRTILGWSPEDLLSGRQDFEALIHPEDLPRTREGAKLFRERGLPHHEQQYRLRTVDGDYRWVHDFSTAARHDSEAPYVLGYLVDITERRTTEEALRQAQKLESLGVLAGGIAHDFNNLLSAILGNLDLAQLSTPAEAPARQFLANMERAVLKAAHLTKQMLAYSGRGNFVVQPQDLNKVVRELAHLLEVSISKKVVLQLELGPALPPIEADVAQVQQVVMNLVTNASDAIGDQAGHILVRTRLEAFDDAAPPSPMPGQVLRPGPYVVLEVQDDGSGMSPEILERIFDPFFTTKATGRGLGLSAMQGILRGHRAGLQIRSRPGEGSTFQVFFPAGQPTQDPSAETAAEPELESSGGRILVVDDEDMILETTRMALSALGFEVLEARDGAEALAVLEAERGRLDLVVMDLTMPRMDGREAFLAMRKIDPGLRIVLCSGFTEQDTLQAFQGETPSAFLQKPYQLKELREVIRQVLRKA